MQSSLLFFMVALPVCLAIVVISASFFVRGAVAIAHRLSLPEFIVGSVIVAIGTSAPEVAINVSAALEDAGDIVVSNIVGSNIVNIALGVGIAGLLLSFDRARKEYTRTIVVGALGAAALLANTWVTGSPLGLSLFSFPFAIGLLLAFSIFMFHSIRTASDHEDDDPIESDAPLWLAIILVIGGALAMAYFSDLAVLYAVSLAETMHIPESVIGATVIAAGGSLPEVSSCIAAARIKRPNLILGNVAGSQIFNILGILGLSGMISSFTYSTQLAGDVMILLGMTVILILCLQFSNLRRFMGPVLVASYGLYAVYLVMVAT